MFAKLRFILLAASILIVLLSLLALLQIHRFKQLLIEVESARISVVGLALKNDVERSLALGLPLRDNGQLAPMLVRTLQQTPGLISIHVVDLDLDPGKILWQAGPKMGSTKSIEVRQRRSPTAAWFDEGDANGYVLGWPITDPIGRLVANLSIRFDKAKPQALMQQASNYVYGVLAALSLLLLVILTPFLLRSLSKLDGVIGLAKNILQQKQPVENDTSSDIGQLAHDLVGAASDLEKAHKHG